MSEACVGCLLFYRESLATDATKCTLCACRRGTHNNAHARPSTFFVIYGTWYTTSHTHHTEVNAAPGASVARVVWHSQTNQIICSTSAGGVRVMYDPAISDKGAMLSAGRSHSRLNTNMFLPKHAVRLDKYLDLGFVHILCFQSGGVKLQASLFPQRM